MCTRTIGDAIYIERQWVAAIVDDHTAVTICSYYSYYSLCYTSTGSRIPWVPELFPGIISYY